MRSPGLAVTASVHPIRQVLLVHLYELISTCKHLHRTSCTPGSFVDMLHAV